MVALDVLGLVMGLGKGDATAAGWRRGSLPDLPLRPLFIPMVEGD